MDAQFHREHLLRLPLPVAQLYSRAYNAKDARSRHDNCYYLFEAVIKLAACPLIAGYVDGVRQGAARVKEIDGLLLKMALPSLGQWMAMLRELARHFGNLPDAASHPLGKSWRELNAPRREPSALLDLYRRIQNGPDGKPGQGQSCSLLQVFEAVVQYRNLVIGHGAGRFESFYERDMGPLLFPAVNELLSEGTFSLLGPPGARLVYLTDLRATSEDRFEVGLRELTGLQGERMTPLTLDRSQAAGLAPNRVAVIWPGRRLPLRLDPLLIFRESEIADEVLLLNRDRSGRQVEYLSYTTGRTERTQETVAELAALLSIVAGSKVSETRFEELAQKSLAETASAETPVETPGAARRQIGDYEILAEIGRGGMGVVYLAQQLSLGRLVALKMLPADLAGDEVALARFRREMRALARCDHPNIVKLLDSGVFADGQVYYTMEYVPGCDLDQVWQELSRDSTPAETSQLGNSTFARAVISASGRRRRQVESRFAACGAGEAKPAAGPESVAGPPAVPKLPLPPLPSLPEAAEDSGGYVRKVAALIRDAAQALQTVHDQGIIHRDVSPGNLMLTPDGSRVVLMDFGLAKGRDLPSIARSLTEKGGFVGKLRYAAREQLSSAMLKVGPQADVHGLGVTLWELLTRKRLFSEAQDERQLATMILERDVPRLRQVYPGFDADLEAIVARATEGRASDRLESAGQMAEYLQLYLDGKPLPIRPPTVREMLWRWTRDHKALAGLAAAVAVTILCALVAVTLAWNKATAAGKQEREARKTADEEKQEANRQKEQAERQRKIAEEKAREAAFSMVFGADILTERRHWSEAQERYRTVARAFQELGIPAHLAEFGAWNLNRWYSPALSLCDFAGHSGAAATVAFSPDGALAASGGEDRKLLIWNVKTGRTVQSLIPDHPVTQLAFSNSGKFILLGFSDGALQTLDTESWKPGPSFAQAGQELRGLALSADGQWAAEAVGGEARIWEMETRALRKVIRHGDEEGIVSVAFSPDGKKLLTGGAHTARISALETDEPPKEIPSGGRAIFSPDGRRVLIVLEKEMTLWDADTLRAVGSFKGHTGLVTAAAFSPDGLLLLSASEDNAVKLWSVPTGENLRDFVWLSGCPCDVAWSPDGRHFLSACRDGTVRLWSPGIHLVESGRRGIVKCLEANRELQALQEYGDEIISVAISRDGRLALSGSADQAVRVWDTATGRELCALTGNEGPVHGLAVSREADYALSGCGRPDADGRLWNLRTGRMVRSFSTPGGWISSAAFSPDNQRAAFASDHDNTIRLFGLEKGEPVAVRRQEAGVNSISVSGDGRHMASGGEDGIVRIWRTGEDRVERSLQAQPLEGAAGKAPGIESVAFSPDGRWLAAGCRDGVVRLWDLRAPPAQMMGAAKSLDSGTEGEVSSIAFVGKTNFLSSAGSDAVIRIWDIDSGLQYRAFVRGHEYRINAVAWSEEGRSLLSADSQGALKLWDFSRVAEYDRFQRLRDEVRSAVQSNPDDHRALRILGEWYAFRGEWEWAVELLERARSLGDEDVSPLMLGRCYWQMDNLRSARREFESARKLAAGSAGPETSDAYLALCLAGLDHAFLNYSLTGATLALPERLFALSDLDKVIALCNDRLAQEGFRPQGNPLPDNVLRRELVAACHSMAAVILADLKDDSGALERYKAACAVRRELAAPAADNDRLQSQLMGTHVAIGRLLLSMQKPAEAEAEFRSALEIISRLAQADPENAGKQIMLAEVRRRVAEALLQAGKADDAIQSGGDALAVWEKLIAAAPKRLDRDGARRMGGEFVRLAAELAKAGRSASAKDMLVRLTSALGALADAESGDDQFLGDVVSDFSLVSRQFQHLNMPDLAAEARRKASQFLLAVSKSHLDDHSGWSAEWIRAGVLTLSADSDDFQGAVSALQGEGLFPPERMAQFLKALAAHLLRKETGGKNEAAPAGRIARFLISKAAGQDPQVLEMLAQVHFKSGEFSNAADAERQAIALVAEGKDKQEMTARLAQYVNYASGKPEPGQAAMLKTGLRVPPGFRALSNTTAEPYTNAGWAREIVHEKTGIEMVFIPAGQFLMGSPANEEGHFDDEGPQHRVRITQPFYMGKYAATQGEWQALMGSNPSKFKGGDRLPVDMISWNLCQEFLVQAGGGLRLPTEAEWEYACRAGTTTRFYAGDAENDLAAAGWFLANSEEKTHLVGQKKPNAWGLYDMHGNVWQWCQDYYDKNYYATSPTENPAGPLTGWERVVRGGPYDYGPAFCRAANRGPLAPSVHNPNLGFRVCADAQE